MKAARILDGQPALVPVGVEASPPAGLAPAPFVTVPVKAHTRVVRPRGVGKAPAHHRGDPASSVVAARMVTESGSRAGQAAQVLSLLRETPGAVASELAAALPSWGGEAAIKVRRRLVDLKAAGLVERGEPRASRVTGRLECEWTAIPAGGAS